MKMSKEGRKIIEFFEGRRNTAYPDPATGAEPITIGIGHTEPGLKLGTVWTDEQVDDAFSKDISKFEIGVEKLLKKPATEGQFDAMVSLAYNIGLGNLASSTLIKLFNVGDDFGAADQFLRWDKAAGKTMLGLRRRRATERERFFGCDFDDALAIGNTIL